MGSKQSGRRERRPSKADRRAAERRQAARRRLAYGLATAAVAAIVVVAVVTAGGGGGVGPAASGDVQASGPPRGEPLAAGERVPEFSAPALEGGRFVWSEQLQGPTVLTVWAPWCPHCQKDLPILGRVAKEFPDVRLVSVVTAIGQSPGPAPDAFLKEHGLSFPTAVDDSDGTLARALGIRGFPTTYYLGADGTVLQTTQGEVPEEATRALFASLL